MIMVTIMVSKLQWYNYNKQTMVVQSQQGNYSSTVMIDKLQWYDYGKPCFYSFQGQGKERGRDRRENREEKEKKKK